MSSFLKKCFEICFFQVEELSNDFQVSVLNNRGIFSVANLLISRNLSALV